MSNPISARLRSGAGSSKPWMDLHNEAADHIDAQDAKIAALVEALGVAEYVLQEDLHNSLTPRVVDIAYNAFLQGGRPNDEDGGESDWFNDTHPMVVDKIAEIRGSIAAAKEPK